MGCILFGMVGFGLLVLALRPLAPVTLRVTDQFATRFGEMPERELVPIRVDRQQHRAS